MIILQYVLLIAFFMFVAIGFLATMKDIGTERKPRKVTYDEPLVFLCFIAFCFASGVVFEKLFCVFG